MGRVLKYNTMGILVLKYNTMVRKYNTMGRF